MNERNLPIIKSNNFSLIIPDTRFAELVSDYWKKNQEHFKKWEPIRNEEFYTTDFWASRLQDNIKAFEAFNAVNFFLLNLEGNKIIGQCTYSNIIPGVFQCCNLGFTIDKEFEGKGFMREALTLGNEYLFERGIHRIQANYLPINERSAFLLKRLGFVIEGYARDYLFINGKWSDHILTSLTNHKIQNPLEKNNLKMV